MTYYGVDFSDGVTEVKLSVVTGFNPNSQVEEIVSKHLPEAVARFIAKNADYRDCAVHLGSRGQFADMNRKFWKMHGALWEGRELHGEPIEEIVQDMIGHCLLTLLFLAQEGGETE